MASTPRERRARRRIHLIGLIGLVVVVAACGDDDDTASPASDDAAATSVVDAAEGPSGAFCAASQAIYDYPDPYEDADASPESIKAAFDAVLELQQEAVALAPQAIKADAERTADAARQLTEILARFDYEVEAALADETGAAELEALEADPEFSAASERLDQYLETECGMDLG